MRIAAASLLVTVLSIGSVAGQTLRVSRTSILNNDPVIVTLAVPSPTATTSLACIPPAPWTPDLLVLSSAPIFH